MRVLVFEDNNVNQRIVGRMLKRLGHAYELAGDGQTGLDHWAQGPAFDLVLMDLELPDMDGYEATRRIRGAESTPGSTPIIALTAHAANEVRGQCIEAGMNDCLGKPIRLGELSAMLEQWSSKGST